MPPAPSPRIGKRLSIKGRPLPFSFWPMQRTTRRYGLQTIVYATNPFALIRDSIKKLCPQGSRPEAQAYALQAEYFFRASQGNQEWAAKPLLLYYSFMNLAKAFILTNSIRSTLDQAKHGISERLSPRGKELVNAYLEAFPSTRSNSNVFADFMVAVCDRSLTSQAKFPLMSLLPQVVAGHRLWASATGSNERFFCVHDFHFMKSAAAKELWTIIQIWAGNLSRYNISHGQLLSQTGLSKTFREVDYLQDATAGDCILQFEQRSIVTFSGRPSDTIPAIVSDLRPHIWSTVTTIPPHRQYYLYMVPRKEKAFVLPQLLSIYAITFYLGSITRYRPQHFDSILNSPFGGYIQEFLTSQPYQFIYLLASEFARRDVTKAAIV